MTRALAAISDQSAVTDPVAVWQLVGAGALLWLLMVLFDRTTPPK